MIKKINSSHLILAFAFVFLLFFCLYPFLVLGGKVLWSGPGGTFTLKYVTGVFKSSATILAIKNTLWVSFASAIIGTLIALPLSWIITRTNIPWAKKWKTAFCLPYAIPPYIGAIAWIYLANPSTGLLNLVLEKGTLNIYSNTGLIWVMSSFFYTFILLSLLSAMERIDPSLEEAARISGAGPFRIFTQITIPIVFPSLMSGFLLVLLAAAASFGVPALIGNPAGLYLMTTRIYTYQKMGSLSGIYYAGALSGILFLIAIAVLVINQKVLSKGHFKTVGGKSSRPSLVDLGSYKYLFLAFVIFLFFVLFILPVCGVFYAALSKVQGVIGFSNLGFQNFYKLFFEIEETPRAFLNSFKLAAGAATVTTFLGMLLGYLKVKTRIKGRSVIEIVASIPYSTPGTVLALAFILAFSSTLFGLRISLYNTLFLIGMTYVAKYLNFSFRTTSDGLGQIDDCLAEASRVSGANWIKTMKNIWFPLMKPSLVASWFLVFMPAFSELTMTILLTGPGLETTGTLLFQLQEYGDASGGGAAVLALVIVFFVALINFFVKFISKGKYGL